MGVALLVCVFDCRTRYMSSAKRKYFALLSTYSYFCLMIELRVRNMVCRHCVEALKGVLSRLGLEAESVTLGGAVLKRSEEHTSELQSQR